MVRDRSTRTLAVLVTVLTVAAAGVAAAVLLLGGTDEEPPPRAAPPIVAVAATDLRRQVVEKVSGPSYAAWNGAWIAPDGALEVAYTTASGPLARDRAPEAVYDAFGYRPDEVEADRDFWNLDLAVRTMRSTDDGRTWQQAGEEPFESLAPHAYSQQATIGLPDGTLIRRVNGDDLRQEADLPHTAFLQRRQAGSVEWGEPQVLLDPAEATYQITRIRRLSDGRLIATGNAWDVPASMKPAQRRAENVPSRFVVFLSGDDGRSWKEALTIPEAVGPLPGNEWDTAELDNGDLLAVMRTATGPDGEPVVKQAVLRQQAGGWTLTDLRPTPFEVTGHPELLRTQEGAILYFATDGIRWTQSGRTWEPVDFGEERLVTHYYPRALQKPDGTVHVFSHLGSDDPYESRRHGILDDAFRLDVTRRGGT